MKHALAGVVLALTLTACAGPGVRDRRDLPLSANPSAVIAAELAFARAAQDKGQWTAFADYAADDATMFVPEPVRAKDWLKGRANPAKAVAWQPHQVWMSCDGSLAVTKGAWQRPDGSAGYFTTVWERQGRNGGYKWVMDQGDTLAEPLADPEMVGAIVADCRNPVVPPPVRPVPKPTDPHGEAADRSLVWWVLVNPDRSREAYAEYWDGTAWKRAILERVAAE